MAVDPRFYIPHVIYFTCGAILFGFFCQAFQAEILLRGWKISPRSVWLGCLCSSSFLYLIVQIDPVGALGIFSDPWQTFLGNWDGCLLLTSLSSAIYMYIIVSYTRFKSQVPRTFSYIWAALNGAAVVLIFIFCLIGAITDNMFWFSVGMMVLFLQEAFIVFGLLISLHKVMQLLKDLEAKGADYSIQRRKIHIVSVVAFVLASVSIGNQLATNTSVNYLGRYGASVPVTHLETFQFSLILPDLLTILVHGMLLYMLRRPRDEDSKTPSRISQAHLTTAASLTVIMPNSPSSLHQLRLSTSHRHSIQASNPSFIQLPASSSSQLIMVTTPLCCSSTPSPTPESSFDPASTTPTPTPDSSFDTASLPTPTTVEAITPIAETNTPTPMTTTTTPTTLASIAETPTASTPTALPPVTPAEAVAPSPLSVAETPTPSSATDVVIPVADTLEK